MRTRKPARTKERYILDSVAEMFKGGEWIETTVENSSPPSMNGSSQIGGEGVSDRGDGAENSTSSAYMTVIGGQKYDEFAYEQYLLNCDETHLVVGDGRGAEKDGARFWDEELNGDLTKVAPDPDRYGKNARKVNVEQVLCFAPDSPLLLVGSGERVKQAKSWLERTLSKREVIELP